MALAFLPGCASSSTEGDGPSHVVVGAGNAADRSVINSTSQRVMSAESAQSPTAAPTPAAPNTGLP